jgi:hypothetical protein
VSFYRWTSPLPRRGFITGLGGYAALVIPQAASAQSGRRNSRNCLRYWKVSTPLATRPAAHLGSHRRPRHPSAAARRCWKAGAKARALRVIICDVFRDMTARYSASKLASITRSLPATTTDRHAWQSRRTPLPECFDEPPAHDGLAEVGAVVWRLALGRCHDERLLQQSISSLSIRIRCPWMGREVQ